MTQGLPGCGKTTWAKSMKGYVRVNKDDLREMLHNGTWSGANEKQILRIRDAIIVDALSHGRSVIVDDTNFADKHGKRLRELADGYGATFIIQFFDVDVEECIKRDSKRPNPVGRKEIMKMYRKYLAPRPPKVKYDPTLPDCIIVDVDGTLSTHEGIRGPFEHEKCNLDVPNLEIVDLVRAWRNNDPQIGTDLASKIIITTGAMNKHRDMRQEWLYDHLVPWDLLLMRRDGDYRPDYEIKLEMYYEHIADKYNVRFILDDRQQVVDMWRSLGLRVLQVAEGDF